MKHSLDYLKTRLVYSPVSGNFFWKSTTNKRFNTRFAFKEAGCWQRVGNQTYITIRVDGYLYFAHRLAWYFETGKIPKLVDHEDGDGTNNRFTNLRNVDKIVNGKNSKKKKNNTSGVNGVYWNKQNECWVAEGHYTENGTPKKINLGSFKDLNKAEDARQSWENRLGGFTERHGK